MEALVQQRCLNHPGREAAARCTACHEFFCRECVTEHDDRLMCAGCLRKEARKPLAERWRFDLWGRVATSIVGFLVAWIVFYYVGRMLLAIPSQFHDETAAQTISRT